MLIFVILIKMRVAQGRVQGRKINTFNIDSKINIVAFPCIILEDFVSAATSEACKSI